MTSPTAADPPLVRHLPGPGARLTDGSIDGDAILGGFTDYVSEIGLELYPAQEEALLELGTAPAYLARACGRCLREGGEANWQAVLSSLTALLAGVEPELPVLQALADPQVHDWRDEPGPRVGVVLYRALLQAAAGKLAE